MTIQLHVKTLTGVTITVDATPLDTAETVKEKIRVALKKQGLEKQHAGDFRIRFGSRLELEAGQTLADGNITEDGTVLNVLLVPAVSQKQAPLVENTDGQEATSRLLTTESKASKSITYNPFRAFIENSNYPAARIYRESIWMGLLDTYKVFVGNHYTGRLRMGIIDVLVFPVIGSALVKYAQRNDSPVAGFFGGILEICRGLIGAALTLAVSPIVLGIHLIATPKARKLKNKLKQVQVYQTTSSDDKNVTALTQNTTLNLLDMLKKDNSELTEVRCPKHEQKAEIPAPENRTYTSYGWCVKTGTYKPSHNTPIYFKVDYSKTPQQALDAFEALNVGRLYI